VPSTLVFTDDSFFLGGLLGEAEPMDMMARLGDVHSDEKDVDACRGALWMPLAFSVYGAVVQVRTNLLES
jgi:hypothetical protein